ncbi:hypothetical protein HALLA_12235 [Halostagnicola larsenii XH-48]|uniref:Uncharacterized protein n=1 Tax=Halostagnicola larsenii XH-48 TaxID=797299 RepID=W0JV73_9EURY|nr:hypothetical protein [Halostagnicola larsenii]AHG00938.1 hypothetical protein HALLA_11920 [Halostagnicola larsenii XH-48]AHG00990.1 hypothetical protein HALLA_12235 [Halostagnicola larsenii XH-48]
MTATGEFPDDRDDRDRVDLNKAGAVESIVETFAAIAERARLEDDDIDQDSAELRRIKTARRFDAAEKQSHYAEPLEGTPTAGCYGYLVGDPDGEEWLSTNYVVYTSDRR